MDTLIASPALMEKLLMGKYTRWAKRLDGETLQAALWAVGEFGSRYWAMRFEDASFPRPHFAPHNMAHDRMVRALKSFATVWGTGRLKLEFGWGDDLSGIFPAFSKRYCDELAADPRTEWAVPLDEQSFGFLLWEIGEYGIRVNWSQGPDGGEYPPPFFDGPADQVGPMRAALKLIAKVEMDAKVTPEDALRIMSAV